MSNPVTFHIRIKSPVHIGCGEDYEPTSFVIDEQRTVLIPFDPLNFVSSLSSSDKERLMKISSGGTPESLLEVYRFMRGKKYPGPVVRLCQGFLDHYQKTLSLRDSKAIRSELNRFGIARTAFDPYTNRPYIPGSALKGALRTAWLNARQKEMNIPKGRYVRPAELERILLDGGSFETDPFRMLKISDFMPVGRVRTRIVYAVNEKKRMSDRAARGPYQILEVIESDSCFQGSITLDHPLKTAGIKTPLILEKLMLSAKNFYFKEGLREKNELSRIGIPGIPDDPIDEVIPIRIGRHSGAESVTIADQRSIKILGKKGDTPKYHDHSTTFWLAAKTRDSYLREQLLPFGWVHLKHGSAPESCDQPDDLPFEESTASTTRSMKAETPPAREKTLFEMMLDELELLRPDDMGRIGTVIQKAEAFADESERSVIAEAIRDKIGAKAYKRHKRHDLLESWIKK